MTCMPLIHVSGRLPLATVVSAEDGLRLRPAPAFRHPGISLPLALGLWSAKVSSFAV